MFHAPPSPVLQSLAALTCWPRKRGGVKVKRSQTPASAHLPETLGLIRELLAENLPNCRKLWRSAAGQITPWERGRQDGVWCTTVTNMRNEAASTYLEGGFEVKCLHIQTHAKEIKKLKMSSEMTSLVRSFGVCCTKSLRIRETQSLTPKQQRQGETLSRTLLLIAGERE